MKNGRLVKEKDPIAIVHRRAPRFHACRNRGTAAMIYQATNDSRLKVVEKNSKESRAFPCLPRPSISVPTPFGVRRSIGEGIRSKSSFIPVRGFTLPRFTLDTRVGIRGDVIGTRVGARGGWDAFIYSAFKRLRAELGPAHWSTCHEGSKSIRSSRRKYIGRTNRGTAFGVGPSEPRLRESSFVKIAEKKRFGSLYSEPFRRRWFDV